jgi:hypothetical protein
MRDDNNSGKRMESGSSVRSGLLTRIRNRTEREQGISASVSDSPYSAAALGQAPYVAMGNGVIVVQRKCSNDWNC